MNLIEVFGKNVKMFRLERGYSQEELANRAGMHRTYVGNIECFRRNVSLKNIQKLAKALEVRPEELLMFNGEEKWK